MPGGITDKDPFTESGAGYREGIDTTSNFRRTRKLNNSTAHGPEIGIFKLSFSSQSERFVTEQARMLVRYSPFFVVIDLRDHLEFPYTAVSFCKSAELRKKWVFLTKSVSSFKSFHFQGRLKLLHAHFGLDGVYGLELARHLGIPLVTTFHGYDITTRSMEFLKSRSIIDKNYIIGLKKLMREGDRFIAVSRFIEGKLLGRGFPKDRVIQHYIGVDTCRFSPGERKPNHRYILCVARHTKLKGIDTLMRAFARIYTKYPDISLVQVGTGPLTKELNTLARRLGIDGRTVIIGRQHPDKIVELMQGAEIYSMPSHTTSDEASEGLGIVFNEASACGLPIVSTRHGGIPEAVIDGETGFLVDEKDDRALADKLDILLSDRDIRERMGKRGREFVCDVFDIRKQTMKLENIYDRTIEEWKN